jgi:hypothetical protein
MAAKNVLMMNLMRILTPEEINELTSKHEGDLRTPLTSLLEEDIGVRTGHQRPAKILPFSMRKKNSILAGPDTQDLLNSLSVEKLHKEDNESEQRKFEPDENGNTSYFILSEKERFKTNQKKLKGKEVMGLYRQASLVDLDLERKNKDNLNRSTKSGVLVNKEQF